jgi:putative membrane protein
MDWGHMPFGYGGIFMWIILLVLIGVIIYLISSKGKLVQHDEETPLEILKKRYAKGEISKQEFEKMKKDLQ